MDELNKIPRFDNHTHSEYSNIRLIDSINRLEDMILTTNKLGLKGLVLTDHETVAGHVRWLNLEKELKEKGKIPQDFKCGCGNEIYLVDDRSNIEKYWHYILIAKNTRGHKALRELSSIAWYNCFTSRGMTRVPTEKNELIEIVEKYKGDLISTTACFRKGALVKTKNGNKKIEDITNNDYILNMYGEWEKVNFPTSRIFNGSGRVITLLENDTPTICTDNHKFLVTTNNKNRKYKSTGKTPYEWVEAKNLVTQRGGTKHILLYPVEKIQYNNKNIIKKKHIEINGVLYKKVYIKSIEEIEINEEVHCLNVNSHSFCCNDVIVHNCLGGELPGLVSKLIKAEKEEEDISNINQIKEAIRDFITFNKNLFGEDFYIEIAAAKSKDQIVFNKRIGQIAKAFNTKIVIGSDAHYLTSKERDLHRAYLNSKNGEREVDSFYSYSHMMDNEEAFSNLEDIFSKEEFLDFCSNSMEIYSKIETYEIFHESVIPEVKVKDYNNTDWIYNDFQLSKSNYPILKKLIKSENFQERYWLNQCLDSLVEHKLFSEEYLQRLEIEADIVDTVGQKKGVCVFKYFNTFQHYINLFWEKGSIVGPGRGSSACFLSNFLLGITQVDSIEWNLKEWRFINKERIELPELYWAV